MKWGSVWAAACLTFAVLVRVFISHQSSRVLYEVWRDCQVESVDFSWLWWRQRWCLVDGCERAYKSSIDGPSCLGGVWCVSCR
ncbi:hypothetical protein RvY_13755-1 [Ramazzottius varieornatus]|uniref:Uncharacterized protein n=1 Tax=Ramazzottius varieornatus TaxID=947166 RepID=A0A1D1VT08_RAMVA|nr:hypothetical protein RvY_13755-1 [Ramazzottius varieornatus]